MNNKALDLRKITEGKNLSDMELSVLNFIVNNMDNLLKIGVRGVAKENYTSTSTVMRLTKKLGYKGFVDMYYKLLPLSSNKNQNINTDISFVNNLSIENLFKYNTYDDMKEFAKKITDLGEGYIFLYATGFSAITMEYLAKKFLVLGIRCIYSNGMDSIGVFENNLDYMKMLIVISRSGETKRVLERVKTAKENKIFTVSFTNEIDNDINNLTDIGFRIEDNHKLDDRNMLANTFFPSVIMLMEILIYEYHKVLQEY